VSVPTWPYERAACGGTWTVHRTGRVIDTPPQSVYTLAGDVSSGARGGLGGRLSRDEALPSWRMMRAQLVVGLPFQTSALYHAEQHFCQYPILCWSYCL